MLTTRTNLNKFTENMRENAATRLNLVGTYAFYVGDRFITQTPKYQGELFIDCYLRAKKGLEIIDESKIPLFESAIPKFYPSKLSEK